MSSATRYTLRRNTARILQIFDFFDVLFTGPQIAGARPQLQPNIPTASPGPHFNATPSSLQPSLTPTTLQLLNSEKTPPALLNHPIPSQASASFPEQVKNEVLPASLASKPDEQMDVEPYVPSREFINPLTYKMKELDLEYVTRSAEETGRLAT